MKKKVLFLFSATAILSCTKKTDVETHCVLFTAEKSYDFSSSAGGAKGDTLSKLTDTITVGKKYFINSFSRTVTSMEANRITDSIVSSEFGDFGKRYRFSVNAEDLMPTYFYGTGALVGQELCK